MTFHHGYWWSIMDDDKWSMMVDHRWRSWETNISLRYPRFMDSHHKLTRSSEVYPPCNNTSHPSTAWLLLFFTVRCKMIFIYFKVLWTNSITLRVIDQSTKNGRDREQRSRSATLKQQKRDYFVEKNCTKKSAGLILTVEKYTEHCQNKLLVAKEHHSYRISILPLRIPPPQGSGIGKPERCAEVVDGGSTSGSENNNKHTYNLLTNLINHRPR